MKLVSNNILVAVVVGDTAMFFGGTIVNPANTLLIMGDGLPGL